MCQSSINQNCQWHNIIRLPYLKWQGPDRISHSIRDNVLCPLCWHSGAHLPSLYKVKEIRSTPVPKSNGIPLAPLTPVSVVIYCRNSVHENQFAYNHQLRGFWGWGHVTSNNNNNISNVTKSSSQLGERVTSEHFHPIYRTDEKPQSSQ